MSERKKKGQKKETNDVTMLQCVPKKRRGGDNAKTSATRALFIRAYEYSFGNITTSCEAAGISRLTFYRWMKSQSRINIKFQTRIRAIQPQEVKLDYLEGKLMQLVERNDTTAVIFGLKTLGKERGYGEKTVDLEYQLVLRAVARLENIITRQMQNDKNYKPDIKRFSELAAEDFGVKPDVIEKEFLKRQPQLLEGLQ